MSEIIVGEVTNKITNFKGIVYLPSDEAFETLINKGTLETDAGTIVYSPLDTTYVTPYKKDITFEYDETTRTLNIITE